MNFVFEETLQLFLAIFSSQWSKSFLETLKKSRFLVFSRLLSQSIYFMLTVFCEERTSSGILSFFANSFDSSTSRPPHGLSLGILDQSISSVLQSFESVLAKIHPAGPAPTMTTS